jgi:site-specific DNA-cytosine methylase
MARILIACEESQATTKAFRKLGHEAFSCDLLPCSGGHPEWHFQEDIFEVIKREPKFDLMVAHPPCTYLTGSGVQWLSHPEDKHLPFDERRPNPKYPNRRQDMLDSVEFVKALYNSDIEHVAIENPVGLLSSRWQKPNQIVQPYMFGDEATKTTCLWLKNLPLLQPTNIVGKGERTVFSSGKSHPKWYADALKNAKTKEERQTLRSKTFPGMAEAFATQWGNFLK